MNRIQDKKEEIQNYLEDLETILPNTLEEYSESLEKRLACERAFEKIIEAVNDFAILIIKQKHYQQPSEDTKAFDILTEKKILPNQLAQRLKQAKGMRNFLAHQYERIDDELVFEALQNNISEDVNEFLNIF